MVGENIFESGLEKTPANYVPLSPISMIGRTASVYPDRPSVVHGHQRFTWGETYARCRRLASALAARGIGRGDTVSIMSPNIPAFVEACFGVPMAGAVLNALNTRLDAQGLAFIFNHAETKVLLTDTEFAPVIDAAVALSGRDILIIDIDDPEGPGGKRLGSLEYEALLAEGDPDYAYSLPEDEWDSLTLNYTSGTTGNPKGVVYSHRGAYLLAMGNALTWALPHFPVYLWTLPMFHCNGWCFPWTITAMAGTHVCLRYVRAEPIFESIAEHGVTHFCAAPIVMSLLIDLPEDKRSTYDHKVKMMTAASAPPAAVIGAMEAMDIEVTHVYGLTEVYGPAVVCAWHPEWNSLPLEERAKLKARQGVRYEVQEGLMVADPDTLEPVPADGETIGEIFHRGNIVMKGYLKNPQATEDSFRGGWFHSGDLGVMHPNGYIQIKDRSKDIIISGGENISSIEVEDALYQHPAVAMAAVVARPNEKWGETPCAFIELKEGAEATAQELVAFCRENLAHYKCPKSPDDILFETLPKSATGKILKMKLRERAKG